LPSAFCHSAKSLPSVRKKALGKQPFADEIFAEYSLPSVITFGKAFAECKIAFAECLRHSAKNVIPVVVQGGLEVGRTDLLSLALWPPLLVRYTR
jgi:hypothetical protein